MLRELRQEDSFGGPGTSIPVGSKLGKKKKRLNFAIINNRSNKGGSSLQVYGHKIMFCTSAQIIKGYIDKRALWTATRGEKIPILFVVRETFHDSRRTI